MDFPMMNEINENTNAAKKEILEAMPAAGATSAEVEAAKTAIIGAMPSGGGLLVPKSMKTINISSTNEAYVTAVNVTGKGEFVGALYAGTANVKYCKVKVTIDGVKVWDGVGLYFLGLMLISDLVQGYHGDSKCVVSVNIPFEKSLKIEVYGSSNSYITELIGSVRFYE